MSNPNPHVLIVGAGLSGLTLAQILRKNNISFSIFERDSRADARAQGWAIALHAPMLAEISASMPADLGPIEQTNHLGPLDHIPAQFVFYDVSKPDWRVGVTDDESGKIVRANRQRLRVWLLQHLHVQYNQRLVRVEERDDKVVAHFEDGSSETGDILVGAEGSRSLVRRHILGGQEIMKPLPVGGKYTKQYPDDLRVLVDKVPVERYRQPGIVLQSVELTADQLPAGRITLAGDAAHSMTPFRGEAGVCAITDGLRLGGAIIRIRDAGGKSEDVVKFIAEYRDDMITRGAKAIRVSNPVLEDHAKDAKYEFYTCGKKVLPLAKESVTI
ncbi:putative FAD-dependent monooxygenase [Colletotrichum sp. SAR11_59]|nr:putative FAD-dependent monooxygenase [Colletotrichum sp. SAR11_59]